MIINKVRLNRKSIVYALFALLLFLVFVRYGLQVDIPRGILLITALLIVFIGDNSEIIAVCMCCIPLYSSVDYLYILLTGMFFLVIRNIKKIKIDVISMVVLLLVIWELLHGFWADFSIKQMVAAMVPFFLLWSLYSLHEKTFCYETIIKIYSIFVIGIGATLLSKIILSSGNNIEYAILNMQRLGNIEENAEMIGGTINPNGLGVMCVLGITVLLQNFLYGSKKKIDLLYTLLLFIIGFLTLSKTFIVCLFLMFCMFLIDKRKRLTKRIKYFIYSFVMILIVGITVSAMFPDVIERFLLRWQENDLLSGRLDIMDEVTKCIWSTPEIFLFGVGLQNYSNKVTKFVSSAPHDSINEILMAWGIPGLILFSLFIIFIIVGAKKRNKGMGIVNFIPLMIILAKAMAGHWITSVYSMLAISLAYLSLVHDFRNSKNLYNEDVSREYDLT